MDFPNQGRLAEKILAQKKQKNLLNLGQMGKFHMVISISVDGRVGARVVNGGGL
jgi:hypothetical protein